MENRDAKFAEESSSRIGQKQRTVALYQLERGELALGLLLQNVVVWAEVNAAEHGRLKLSKTENGVLMRFIEVLLIDGR